MNLNTNRASAQVLLHQTVVSLESTASSTHYDGSDRQKQGEECADYNERMPRTRRARDAEDRRELDRSRGLSLNESAPELETSVPRPDRKSFVEPDARGFRAARSEGRSQLDRERPGAEPAWAGEECHSPSGSLSGATQAESTENVPSLPNCRPEPPRLAV